MAYSPSLTASEWAFVDPEANGQTRFNTWREVLGLESFLFALSLSFLLHSHRELTVQSEDSLKQAFLAPALIGSACTHTYHEKPPFITTELSMHVAAAREDGSRFDEVLQLISME
eukprot:6373763-Prymnesium_polylepis.2